MSLNSFRSRRAVPFLLALICSACTVGPDYRGAPDIAAESLKSGTFVRTPPQGVDVSHAPAKWWLALNDPKLNDLVDAALSSNPDVKIAQAKLRQARSQLRGQEANGMPKASASAAALRMRSPDLGSFAASNAGGSDQGTATSSGRGPLDFYTAGFDASWELDLFGGTRRAVEAASDEADAVKADLADTQVSLAAEVASTYVGLRDQQRRLALGRSTAEYQQQMLTLTEQRRARGTAADVDVERLTTQVDTTRATLVPLQVQITDSLDQLAVLTGRAPGALDAQLGEAAPLPDLPASVAIGEPSAMLQQRPDIRAAERRLASSNAQIGEHVADYFPKVTLLGDIGFTASDPGHLLRKQNFSWLGVPYLQWNVLDFGRTAASVDTAKASRDEAEARYEKTVLAALKDANSALARYGYQREHLVRLEEVNASSERAAILVRQRYKAGVSTLIDLLDAQRTQFAAQQDVVAAQGELLKDFVSLQKSLGLGWQQGDDANQLAAAH
ncbi:efflux transporter outer membrane subunit [Caballeronia sp. GAWG1-1]|uniref:efflux transporter outer membrane subunit n=1 Tax=Caballeronia sp. GAWG1-1 TaxID=2921742 RepID=UPI0020290B0E|nr:efflux transporter outer membrane subunit [Caballeronia sp. GAWG1-1]